MKRFLSAIVLALILASCSQTPVPSTNENTGGQSSASPLSRVEDPRSSSGESSVSSASSASSVSSSSSSVAASSLPRSLAPLAVPFSPQAPFANWDALHEESCEEMSLIMVHHFLKGTSLTREQAEQEIQDLVQWETEHGYPMDVTVAELKEIALQYYGHESRIVENPTIDDLKRLLADGQPVIVPAAGRMLGNPYFSGDGPWYHMLVLTGYGWLHFITNDPGTRRGEEYEYRFSTLMNAIHDWTGIKEEIQKGRSAVLVLELKP